MDLSFCPFLLVSRIYHDIFSLMLQRLINLTANNTVAGPAASLGVYHYVRAYFLRPIHDQTMNDSELTAFGLAAKIIPEQTASLRFFGHQNLHILGIGKEFTGTALVSCLEAFADVRGASQSAGENKIRLDHSCQSLLHFPSYRTYNYFSSMTFLQSF
jgi:hypothetical protein